MKTINNNQLIINFKGNTVIVNQTEDGLYCLNDVYKASGKTGQLRDSLKNLSDKAVSRFGLVQINGGNQRGTYGNQRCVLWLAAKLDDDFEDVVFEAFELLSNGNYLEASDKALTAVVTQEFKAKYKTLQDALYDVFEVWNKTQAHERGFDIILKNFVQFNTCGITSKKVQRESGMNLVDNLLATGNTEGITAMMQSMVMVTNAMKADLGYYQIKLMVASHLFTEDDAVKMKTDLSSREEARTGSYKTSDEDALKDDF